MSQAQTSRDTPNVISSPESAVGPKLSALPGGQQIVLFGQDHAPVNHFPAQVNDKEKRTNGTFGQSSTGSSPSAILQLSLENRLQARLDVNGSPEYALTWKRWDMPSGPPICALRASARRISDKDYTGWPTPTEDNANNARGHKGTCYSDLPTIVQQVNLISGQTPSGFLAKTEKPAGLALNPHFSRWLMGYRAEWLCSEVLETLSSRK